MCEDGSWLRGSRGSGRVRLRPCLRLRPGLRVQRRLQLRRQVNPIAKARSYRKRWLRALTFRYLLERGRPKG